MVDETGTEQVSEDQIAQVTAKLMQWSATLTEVEQIALASILEAAVGDVVQFTVLVPPGAEAHTVHLHGHPWFVPSKNGKVTRDWRNHSHFRTC